MNRPIRIWLTVVAAICASGLAPRAASAEVIEIPLEIQISSQWCWAAVSDSILGYYGFEGEQCDIAEYTRQVATWHNYGPNYCCEKPNGQCNYWNYLWGYDGSVADILDHFGAIATEGVDAPLSSEDCQGQIASNRPFIVRWVWDNGGGHFVIGHGIEPDGTFYYMDPWFGEGSKISTYDWMVEGGNHTWTHTQKMATSPCDCHATNECCDGCWILNENGACDADGSGCTSGDTCAAGTCVPGPTPDCSVNDNQCNTGICESTGADSFACGKDPTPFEGVVCNADDDGCTAGDVCAAGLCVPGQAADCSNDVGQCEEGVCISQGPDEHLCTSVTATMDGQSCDDENLCTVDDICLAGECGGAEKDCSDSFACTITWCDPANGECAVEADQATCDDSNPCTVDLCSTQVGCGNTGVPEWLPCQDTGFACFSGRCEKLAGNDTFGSPTTIELDTPYYGDRTKLHAYLEVPETCFGTATAGHDAFFVLTGEPGTTYRLTLTPDEGILTALAVWNGTDEEAVCTSGIEATDTEKTLVLPDDATSGIIIQVVFIDTLANGGPTGATIIVSAESGGDEWPDVAEVTQVEVAEEVHVPDAMGEVAVVEELPEAGEEIASTDLVVFHDSTSETAATDSSEPGDADAVPAGDIDSIDDLHPVDANADDGSTKPPHGNGSGCAAGSRGTLPATASLIFLVATAFAIPGLIRRRRNGDD